VLLVLAMALGVPAAGRWGAPADAGSDRFSVEADGNRLIVWRAVPVVFSAIHLLAPALERPLPPEAHAIRLHRQAPPETVYYVLCVTGEGTLVLGQQLFSSSGPEARPVLVRGEIVRSYPPLETSGPRIWLVEIPLSRERGVVLAVRASSADGPVRAVAIMPAGAEHPGSAPEPDVEDAE
jgi:hypothetical protein